MSPPRKPGRYGHERVKGRQAHRSKTRQRIWLQRRRARWRAGAGKPSGDPSKRIQIRYRRIFERTHLGIVLVDPATLRIIEVNPFMTGLLGYAPGEFIGKELWEIGLLKDREACEKALAELMEKGLIRHPDLPLETKDGRRRQVEFVGTLDQQDGYRIIQCNIQDITETKRVEEALREAQTQLARHTGELEQQVIDRTAELNASTKQLEAFVYSVAHDLRAPLRAMQGFSQALVEQYGNALDDTGRQYLQRISQSAQSMDCLIMDLLTFSRVSQQEMELGPVNLESAVHIALGRQEQEIQEKNAHVAVFSPFPSVLAHEATLGQVLANLISNALKFVPPGVAPQIRIRAEEQAATVRVWVEDNGLGIPQEQQERIFQIFQRLHTSQYPGTGIGLAIVKKGIERMGGRVGVESVPGQGSRFWIELAKANEIHVRDDSRTELK